MAGAPKGNKNACKSKPWEQALKRALARAGNSIELGLDPIADKVVAAASGGDMHAIAEIANRLDGKPTQQVEATVEHSGEVEHIGLSATLGLIEGIAVGSVDRPPPESLPH